MKCPKCDSCEVERLPPSPISPQPGYLCNGCGAKLRAPRTLPLYLVALALGAGLFGLFLYLILGFEGNHPMPLKGFWLAGVGLVCAGYAVIQLARPVPRRDRPDSDPR
jgi:hypothetical protein